jgi:hypothetical protein
MNDMFEPKGEKPYWELVYEYIKDFEVDDVISYADISESVGFDVLSNRSSVYKARKQLLEDTGRYLDIERGVGYKVIDGLDIMKHAKNRHKYAKHQIVKADFETTGIDVTSLTDEDKKKVQDFMVHNASIQLAFKQTAKNVEMGLNATREHMTGMEARMASAQVTQLFTEKQLDKLKELIGE